MLLHQSHYHEAKNVFEINNLLLDWIDKLTSKFNARVFLEYKIVFVSFFNYDEVVR